MGWPVQGSVMVDRWCGRSWKWFKRSRGRLLVVFTTERVRSMGIRRVRAAILRDC